MNLFDQVPPHQPHIATSRDAAHSVKHKTRGRRQRVLTLLRAKPMTDQELWWTLKDDPADPGLSVLTTVQACRCALRDAGLVFDSGVRRANAMSRRLAIVWAGRHSTGALDTKRATRRELEAAAIAVVEAAGGDPIKLLRAIDALREVLQ